MSQLFTIDCGDIYLREFQFEDANAIYELTSQPEVYEFLPDWRSSKEQRIDWLNHYELPENKRFLLAVPEIGNYFLKLGMFLKENNKFIGFCNTGIKDELDPPNREIAFAISKHHRNKGYTTKAAKGLINYLFENTDVEQLNAVALPRNKSSNKVLLKCGFHFHRIVDIDQQHHYHYTLTKKDWVKK